MSIRTWEEAEGAFGADVPLLVEAVEGGWSDFLGDHSALRHGYEKRTQANLVHDYVTQRLTTLFSEHPDWTPRRIRKHRLFLLDFKNDFSMKVKKLDRSRRSRNVVTQMVLNFMHQAQAHLPGFAGPTSLVLGYQLNAAETEIAAIWITCPDGSRHHWEWELPRLADVLEMPSLGKAKEAAAPGKIVRPKVPPKPDEIASSEPGE